MLLVTGSGKEAPFLNKFKFKKINFGGSFMEKKEKEIELQTMKNSRPEAKTQEKTPVVVLSKDSELFYI